RPAPGGKADETQLTRCRARGRVCRVDHRRAGAEFSGAVRDPHRAMARGWFHRCRHARARNRHRKASWAIDRHRKPAGQLGHTRSRPDGRNRKADGYTISQIPITIFRFPFMTKTSFDPSADFTYIIGVSGYTFGVVVRDDAPWKTFQEFLADAKANPGKINYGTPGAGTSLHITMEQIAKRQGIKWTPVPFKGNAESMNALLGGHIHPVADSSGWAPLVNAGRFRLLVTWGAARTKNWPDVPTLRDIGIDMVSNSPFGIAGPRGLEASVVKILHDAFKKGLEEPSYAAAMASLD